MNKNNKSIYLFFILLSLILAFPLQAKDNSESLCIALLESLPHFSQERFNESLDNPSTRTISSKADQILEYMSKDRRKWIQELSAQRFKGDNSVAPFARILTETEYTQLKAGVAQRLRAFFAFLDDHFYGERSYLKVIPEQVINRIFRRTLGDFPGSLPITRKGQFSILYGPDIMRGPDGVFRINEDNVGNLGGLGDLGLLQRTFLEIVPEMTDLLPPFQETFYHRVVAQLKKRAKPSNGTIVVLQVGSDHGKGRVADAFYNAGAIWARASATTHFPIYSDGNQVFVNTSQGQKPVGVLLPHIHWSELWGGIYQTPNSIKTYRKGKVAVSHCPESLFFSDKEFYIYLPQLIKHYLNEEPLLEQIPTVSFALSDGSISKKAITIFQNNPAQFVVKTVNDSGGEGVFIGNQLSTANVHRLISTIRSNPSKWILQVFQPSSVVQKNIADIRIHTFGTEGEDPIFPDAPWGRAAPVTGDQKVNISEKGKFAAKTAVFVVPDNYMPPETTATNYLYFNKAIDILLNNELPLLKSLPTLRQFSNRHQIFALRRIAVQSPSEIENGNIKHLLRITNEHQAQAITLLINADYKLSDIIETVEQINSDIPYQAFLTMLRNNRLVTTPTSLKFLPKINTPEKLRALQKISINKEYTISTLIEDISKIENHLQADAIYFLSPMNYNLKALMSTILQMTSEFELHLLEQLISTNALNRARFEAIIGTKTEQQYRAIRAAINQGHNSPEELIRIRQTLSE